MINIRRWALALYISGLLLPGVAAAAGETYILGVDASVDKTAAPQVLPLGKIRINGQAVPAYGLRMSNPAADGMLDLRPAQKETLSFKAAITPAQTQQVAAYYHSFGWLLVPRGWQPVAGGLGANGSESLLFMPPNNSGYVQFYHTSACVGCAQIAASAFFPEAAKDATANDFPAYTGTDVPLQQMRLRPHFIGYRATKNGQRIDGLAYYNRDADLPFWKAELSLPSTQGDLAQPILNWLLPKR